MISLRNPTPDLKILSKSQRAAVRHGRSAYLGRFFVTFAKSCRRTFPWRARPVSAYRLLVAEVLLRQTRAEDAVDAWRQITDRYPDFAALERARPSHLRSMLRRIGLHCQRQRALSVIARVVNARFHGRLPSTAEDLLSIPHVGLYTACALLSFRSRRPVPIVDANVLRVLGRVTGKSFGRDARRSLSVWALAWGLLPTAQVVEHNYGLLDFAALVCVPRRPKCEVCPISQRCSYGHEWLARSRHDPGELSKTPSRPARPARPSKS